MFFNTTFKAASRLTSTRASSLFVKPISIKAPAFGISGIQTRFTATNTSESVTQDKAYSILVAQRKLRPVSPHLRIYQLQLTSCLSITHRITGAAISGGIYAFALAYLASPALGLHLESATIAAAFGALPIAAKIGIKGMLALPFTYHSWNGVRHLMWDTGKALDIKGVYRSGYVVLGLTTLSTVYLAFL